MRQPNENSSRCGTSLIIPNYRGIPIGPGKTWKVRARARGPSLKLHTYIIAHLKILSNIIFSMICIEVCWLSSDLTFHLNSYRIMMYPTKAKKFYNSYTNKKYIFFMHKNNYIIKVLLYIISKGQHICKDMLLWKYYESQFSTRLKKKV